MINISLSSSFENGDESEGAIVDVHPIANLLSAPIERKRLVTECLMNELGNEFFAVLARPVAVCAAGNDDVLEMSRDGREGQKIG